MDVPNATRDGDRARRALRPGPAPPAPRPRGARRGRRRPACWSATAGCPTRRAARLEVMVRTDDGFADRREGPRDPRPRRLLRHAAVGLPSFRVAHLIRDRDLLEQARARGVPLRRARRTTAGRTRCALPGAGRLGAALRPGPRGMSAAHHRRPGKGRRLKSPRGLETRPTGARVRQTLFDILAPELPGCRFLDAFAGSGGDRPRGALARGGARRARGHERPRRWPRIQRERRARSAARAAKSQVFRQDARVALAALADRGRALRRRLPRPALRERPLRAAARAARTARPARPRAAWRWPSTSTRRALPETIGRLVRTREVRVGDHRLSFYRRRSYEVRRRRERGAKRKSLAVFPGSFDPITNGHLDIIARGLSRLRRGHRSRSS